MRVAYHRIDRIPNIKPCPRCTGPMDDITDVKANEGFGPRTYRYQQCVNISCKYTETANIDNRGWPGDAGRFEPT